MSQDSPLLSQPSEVVASITAYLAYDDVLRLYCTNNRKLVAVLTKSSGVRTLTYQYKSEQSTTKQWPSLQSKLITLKEFAVTSTAPATDVRSAMTLPTPQQIMDLPKSLTSLKFVFWYAESCFCNMGLNELPTCLPNLLYLELGGNEAIGDIHVPHLPASLLSLNLHNNRLLTDAGVALLPPGLTSLSLPKNAHVTLASLSKLKQLTVLRLHGQNIASGDVAKASLPITLEYFELMNNQSLRGDDLCHLPPTLSTLSLRMNNKFQGTDFGLLPSALISLTWGASVIDANLTKLPKELTFLTLVSCDKLSDESIGLLPRTLTHLDLWRLHVTDKAVALLPRGLRYLFLASSKLTDECALTLPPQLLHLKLNFSSFTDKFLMNLRQPFLRQLELNQSRTITDQGMKHLPATLHVLHMVSADLVSYDCFAVLPPTLRVLNVLRAGGFAGIAAEDVPKSLQLFLSRDFSLTPSLFP